MTSEGRLLTVFLVGGAIEIVLMLLVLRSQRLLWILMLAVVTCAVPAAMAYLR